MTSDEELKLMERVYGTEDTELRRHGEEYSQEFDANGFPEAPPPDDQDAPPGTDTSKTGDESRKNAHTTVDPIRWVRDLSHLADRNEQIVLGDLALRGGVIAEPAVGV